MHTIKSIVSSRHETSGGKRINTAITFPKYMRDQKINIKSASYTIQPSISYPLRKILMLVKAQTTIMEPDSIQRLSHFLSLASTAVMATNKLVYKEFPSTKKLEKLPKQSVTSFIKVSPHKNKKKVNL